jgi:GT2 family glycosyltransferase
MQEIDSRNHFSKEERIQDLERLLEKRDTDLFEIRSSLRWKIPNYFYKLYLRKVKGLIPRFFFVLLKPIFICLSYLRGINLSSEKEKKDDSAKEDNIAKNNCLSEVLDNFSPYPQKIPAIPLQDKVDIIIPIYNGYEYLEVLIRSIFSNTASSYRLILIDDCSPDERVGKFLKTLENKQSDVREILFLRNEVNLGFVKTVNRGMKLAKNHFVILNTDTEVPKGWLERILFPIYRDKNIASVTPFTNAGEICSFPIFLKNNNIFENLEINEIDKYFQMVIAEKNYLDLPTGVGFCMAINKAIAEEIGLFDELSFSKGYGEENDWCQRAIKKGYKNVIAPNLFIYHKHGGSFQSKEKRNLQKENLIEITKRYKNYLRDVSDFIQRDPLKKIRDFLILLISSNIQDKNKIILIIDNELGGGANFYRDDVIKEELEKQNSVLLLTYRKDSREYSLKYFYKSYKVDYSLKHFKEIERLSEFVRIKKIIVNDLVSFRNSFEILSFVKNMTKKSRIENEFLVHDYFCLCPNYVLLGSDGKFCDLPKDLRICQKCLSGNIKKPNKGVEITDYNISLSDWRESWKDFLDSVDQITCFSNSSKEILERTYPDLIGQNKIVVHPHKVEYVKQVEGNSSLIVGILGGINYIKGLEVVKKILSLIEEDHLNIKIVILGEVSENIESKNIIVHGKYNREEILRLTVLYGIDLFLIPSVIPETFSYTTEEVITMNYPVAVFDLGAPAERVKLYKKGIIIPKTDAQSALDEILKFGKINKLKD